jgi:hypothetical protein
VLSIIALILVFSSNIVTLVHDVQAVNRFLAAGDDADMADCDYIEYVLLSTYRTSHLISIPEAAPSPIKLLGFFGPCSTAC